MDIGSQHFMAFPVVWSKIYEDYELFGTMNINYLKLDKIPLYEDGWQPVLDVLSQGQFFVTTGEVLITEFSVDGSESGETTNPNEVSNLIAELEWTYPLSYMEIVSGDGNSTYRERINLTHTKEFNAETINRLIDLSDRRWVRIEVWDIARNGAFTQPVWVEN